MNIDEWFLFLQKIWLLSNFVDSWETLGIPVRSMATLARKMSQKERARIKRRFQRRQQRRQVPKVSELQNQGSNYICYKMATIGFYQKHVVLKSFQISTFLKVAHSYAFIMKTLMISGLSFALCQSKRSTNMAGRKEPSRISEVYKDLLSSNADSMDGS